VFQAPGRNAGQQRGSRQFRLPSAIQGGAQVAGIIPPIPGQTISLDGRVAFAQVQYTVSAIAIVDETRQGLQAAVDAARATGLQVEVGGDVLRAIPEAAATEAIGVAVAAVVLVVTLGSLVAAGLPFVTGLIGVGIGISVITAATGFIELSTPDPCRSRPRGGDRALFISRAHGTARSPPRGRARSAPPGARGRRPRWSSPVRPCHRHRVPDRETAAAFTVASPSYR
jgi:hypothetical protein